MSQCGEIGHAGVDRARAADVVHRVARHDHHLPVHEAVGCGHVRAGPERRHRGVRVGHAQRGEDPLTDEVVPLAAAGGLDHQARRDVQHVVIRVGRPEARHRRHHAEAADDLVAPVVRMPPGQVAGAEAEPAPVRQQVTNGEFAGDPRIIELEPGQKLLHPVVPAELPLVDQHGQRGGGERLGVGRDLEDRVLVDRFLPAGGPRTVPLERQHLAVLHDHERQPGHLQLAHRAGHPLIEIGRRAGQRHPGRLRLKHRAWYDRGCERERQCGLPPHRGEMSRPHAPPPTP